MKIGICIVDYGNPEYLKNCIQSLKDWKNKFFFHKILDCNVDNLGFTKGNNELIKSFNDCEWIWLLNNDTIVPVSTSERIWNVLGNSIDKIPNDVGIIGFKILSMDSPDLIHHAGTVQAFPNGIHKSGSVKLRQFNKRTYEKWVTFASVLIRREVFETCGLLDERFFNYFSDSDFCYTARTRGWKVLYEPSFVIHHKIGQSGNPSDEQKKVMTRDMIQFQSKWLNGKLFYDFDNELVNP